jgi:hypothetical protein
MGSMGWLGWIMPLTFLLLIGLSIASLVKYLFRRSYQGDHS